MSIGNYAQHAALWDWSGIDNTAEYEYWCEYAKPYGKNILSPMCAWGETGAYMATHGFCVTAFDFTDEMVEEGNKRFRQIENFKLLQGDIRNFSFEIPPVDFVFIKDLGHILTIEDVKAAFTSIYRHMRVGGALVLELGLPPKESKHYPKEIFYPFKQVYPDKEVWKEGTTFRDAEKKRTYISQTIYIKDANGTEQFDHSFYLQAYERDEMRLALHECGFIIAHEYRNREKEECQPNDGFWIVEAIKAAI